MTSDRTAVVIAMLTLAAGTFAFRLAGPLLGSRITFPPRARQLLETSAVVLLAALVTVSALTTGHSFAGLARPAGVAVGAVLAWRRLPFFAVVVGAAMTAAILRAAGFGGG